MNNKLPFTQKIYSENHNENVWPNVPTKIKPNSIVPTSINLNKNLNINYKKNKNNICIIMWIFVK